MLSHRTFIVMLTLTAAVTGTPARAFDAACVTVKDPAGDQSIAKEIIAARAGVVYIAGAGAPIADTDWPGYMPPRGMIKNTTRHLLFDDSCYLRSFSAPAECRGDACLDVRMIDGHSWVALARAVDQYCLPDAQGCGRVHGEPGNLRATRLIKCHLLKFRGEIFELLDPTGNRFVMHATAGQAPDPSVPLPPGWKVSRQELKQPLVVRPQSPLSCEYTLVRDAFDQSYHQYGFDGEPLFHGDVSGQPAQ